MITISKIPHTPKLDNYVKKSLKNNILDVLIDIVFKYLDKCVECKHYYNEEYIKFCECKLSRCVFCHYTYTKNNNCNKCIIECTILQLNHYGPCIKKNCKNDALFGTKNAAVLCKTHSIDKLLINHCHFCSSEKCYNDGIYVDNLFNNYCIDHKTNSCKLSFQEGYAYKSKNKKMCNDCGNKYVILYKCSCGLLKCINCTNATMFVNDVIKQLVCNKCCKYSTEYKIYKILDLKPYCAVYKCNNDAINYNYESNMYMCHKHSNNYFVFRTRRCNYSGCNAISTIYGNCPYHKNNEEE
jgi:hypothetical protein